MTYGLHKSPFSTQDYLMTSFLDEKPLPKDFDLTSKMTPVRSQGNEGACAGFAGVGVMEYLNNVLDYPDYEGLIRLSPRFIYEEAKKISGHKEGTTLKAVAQVAKNLGTCEEAYWKYYPKKPGVIGVGGLKNAEKYKIKVYARIRNLQELKSSLVQFGTLLVGIKVWKNIGKSKDGIVPKPKGWRSYGHAIEVCAYNDEERLVKFKNSWGTKWGNIGFGYISYDYIRQHMLDAFSFVDIDDPLPYVKTVRDLSPLERETSWV